MLCQGVGPVRGRSVRDTEIYSVRGMMTWPQVVEVVFAVNLNQVNSANVKKSDLLITWEH